jgi:hypothetical protein
MTNSSNQDFSAALLAAAARSSEFEDAINAGRRAPAHLLAGRLLEATVPPVKAAALAASPQWYGRLSDEPAQHPAPPLDLRELTSEIDGLTSLEQLQARRRAIARVHHPDLVPKAFRHKAEEAMKEANARIDRRIAALTGAVGK